MASTFSQIKSGLNAVSDRIVARRTKLQQAKQICVDSVVDLNQLGTDYATLVSDIDALATASPSDPAATTAKAEKDRLVAEFTALKTVATNGQNAITA